MKDIYIKDNNIYFILENNEELTSIKTYSIDNTFEKLLSDDTIDYLLEYTDSEIIAGQGNLYYIEMTNSNDYYSNAVIICFINGNNKSYEIAVDEDSIYKAIADYIVNKCSTCIDKATKQGIVNIDLRLNVYNHYNSTEYYNKQSKRSAYLDLSRILKLKSINNSNKTSSCNCCNGVCSL